MPDPVTGIYRFFRTRRKLFALSATVMCLVILAGASRIRFAEDITQAVPGGADEDQTATVIRHISFSDRLIVLLSARDTAAPADPATLAMAGERLYDTLIAHIDPALVKEIAFRASDSVIGAMMDTVVRHLPVFLDSADYRRLDSMTTPAFIRDAMGRNFRILASPAGMMARERIRKDPLGISGLALEKLKVLNAGGSYDIFDGIVFSRDHRHLLIFIVPANRASETSANDRLMTELTGAAESFTAGPGNNCTVQFFGGPAVAVANARQLKTDVIVTLVIAYLLIFLLIGWYYRSVRVPLLGLLPALFGGSLALAVMAFTRGSLSAISLGIGSVILGLIVDYSLYLVNHYRKSGSVEATLREMSQAIILCSLTTAGTFLCLTFLESAVLRDLGRFAAISVAGAALFSLTVLPHLLPGLPAERQSKQPNFIDRIARYPFDRKRAAALVMLAIIAISAFFAGRSGFEKDLAALNFVTPELARAEADLDRIGDYRLKNLFLVATGKTPEEALRSKERLTAVTDNLVSRGIVRSVSGAGPLLASDSAQKAAIARWERYWTNEKISAVINALSEAAAAEGFKPGAFEGFLTWLEQPPTPLPPAELLARESPLLADWLARGEGVVMAPVILRVAEPARQAVYDALPGGPGYVLFDRQGLTGRFVERVQKDFDRLVRISMVFVTLFLVISFGRLGLGILAALPMYLAWVVTLGFMGLTGMRFNIFNIIVSSFVFGLGVEHSILMMRGLQDSLRTGRDSLPTYKVAILLSALTTIFGVGALLFARHPALHSIALVSVTGITAVVAITFILLPLVFNRLVLSRARAGRYPVTLRIAIKTFVTWGNIVMIAVALMILGTFINLVPVARKRRERWFHSLFHRFTKAYIAFTFGADRKLVNETGEDFSRPAIIISNHQSLIETPAFLQLHPKIIILTRTWVYRSPVFGPIARLAGYPNVDDGIEEVAKQLKSRVAEGYSVLIFPEGHRSADHRIQRFHRGAFYLAEQLGLDILPVLVFGTGEFLGKGVFWGRPNGFRMKVLPRVAPGNPTFGVSYQERTRLFRRYYIREYAAFRAEEGDANYYRRLLSLNYVLKGPVLEWYMRVKLKLEGNYELFNRLLPRRGNILDLGCGYGFITYMMMFTGEERFLTGVDYDGEKIALAAASFSACERIRFETADIREYPIGPHDGFILGDVLHYLEPGRQEELLAKCCTNLKPGGIILIREANAELTGRHEKSRLTEFFSTRSGFNKTGNPSGQLWFTSAGDLRRIAATHGLTMETIDPKRHTSNNLFVLRRP